MNLTWDADSEEVAPAYRDDLAPGFRHDVAPWAGAAGDGIVGAEPAFVNRPIDLISLIAAVLWVCGQRAALSKLVLQDKCHTHSRYGSALDAADLWGCLRRKDSPASSTRWALWTRRSRTASA